MLCKKFSSSKIYDRAYGLIDYEQLSMSDRALSRTPKAPSRCCTANKSFVRTHVIIDGIV